MAIIAQILMMTHRTFLRFHTYITIEQEETTTMEERKALLTLTAQSTIVDEAGYHIQIPVSVTVEKHQIYSRNSLADHIELVLTDLLAKGPQGVEDYLRVVLNRTPAQVLRAVASLTPSLIHLQQRKRQKAEEIARGMNVGQDPNTTISQQDFVEGLTASLSKIAL